MARNHAQLTTAGITDPDWIALGAGPQWLYVYLLRQPRLTLMGHLDVLFERWAAGAVDVSPGLVERWFDTLVAERYLLHDTTTGEVLIRTFTKHDLRPGQLTRQVSTGFWSQWIGILSSPIKRQVVADAPEPIWERLVDYAPPEAAEMRRSGPIDWEPPPPIEREAQSPFEPPSTFHLPPAAHPSFIISPTGRGEGDRSGAESASPEHPSPAGDTPTTVGADESPTGDTDPAAETTDSTEPVLEGADLEQAVRRTAVLIGRRQTASAAGTIDDAEAYAATCTRRLIDKRDPDFTPEPREAITAALLMGMSPEETAEAWLSRPVDDFGFPTGDQPRADDPEAIAKAAERAKTAEAKTTAHLAAQAAIEPAPIPDHLRRKNRHKPEPEAADAEPTGATS
jgi:hypothetical protein